MGSLYGTEMYFSQDRAHISGLKGFYCWPESQFLWNQTTNLHGVEHVNKISQINTFFLLHVFMFKAGNFAYNHCKYCIIHIKSFLCFHFHCCKFSAWSFHIKLPLQATSFSLPYHNITDGGKILTLNIFYLLVTCFPIFLIQFSFIQNQNLYACKSLLIESQIVLNIIKYHFYSYFQKSNLFHLVKREAYRFHIGSF